jgi:DNA-binding GntR family transcriptional regulator
VKFSHGSARWFQIAEHLRGTIAGRRPGDPERLPTEEDLASHYGVSVMTVRQALSALAEEGLVVRHRRRGTFVSPDAPLVQPFVLRGAVDAVVTQQAAGEVEILQRATVPVPAPLAAYFGDRETVVFVRRLRKEGGIATSVADNWVLPEVADQISDNDLRAGPMTLAVRDRANVQIGRLENVVEARQAGPEIGNLLGVALLSPVLLCRALSYDVRDRVVDAATIHYRGDRFRYAVTLRADG